MAARKEVAAALANVPLFSELSGRELQRLARAAAVQVYAPGTDIVTEGDMGGPVYVVLSGTVNVRANGKHRRFAGPGEAFGEFTVIDGGRRSGTVTAENKVTAAVIPSWEFLSILEEHWSIARKVMASLCRHIRELDKSS